MKVGTRIWLVTALLGLLGAASLAAVLPAFRATRDRYEAVLYREAAFQRGMSTLRALMYERAAARAAFLISGATPERASQAIAQRQWERTLSDLRSIAGQDVVLREQIGVIEHATAQLERSVWAEMLDLGEQRSRGRPATAEREASVVIRARRELESLRARIDALEQAHAHDEANAIRAAREATEQTRARLVAAALCVVIAAIFAAASLWQGLRAPLTELTAMAQRIAVGQHQKIGWKRPDELGDLGRAIEAMSEALEERERALSQRTAIAALDARFVTALSRATDVRAVSEAGLALLAEAVGAYAGALFVRDTTSARFVAEASTGGVRTELITRGIQRGEGLLGHVAADGATYLLRPAPDEAPRLETSTVDRRGAAYLAQPVCHGDEVIGVLELACLREPEAAVVAHLEALRDQLAVALSNALANREREKLLGRLEAQYAEIRAREERLLAQSDTLDAQTRELARKNDALQSANQMKSQFIATMSHELRTPLNSILGFTELLLTRSRTLSPDDRATLTEVRSAGRHLLSLINDILDLARIGAGKLGLRRSTVPLGIIAREVIEVLRPQAANKQLDLSNEVPTDLTVEADPSRLRQILLNLAGNAVKFTEQGTVRTRARVNGDRVRVEIVDTGPGITESDRAKLFREFSQIDSSGHRHEGSGLGLAIARELVIAHGGEIGVESTPGQGSVFWFEMPLGKPLAELPEASPQREVRPERPPSLRPPAAMPEAIESKVPTEEPLPSETPAPASAPRILLVEDHPRNARLIEAMLTPEGYRLDHVLDGRSAVERALVGDYDAILLDLELPELDGFEVARQLRADERTATVPIIAVTARALPAEEARARAIGCDDFITKPVDMARLRTALSALLAQRKASGA